jgi:RNA polymerase sigma-70 factor (ECF subfamily)
MSTDKYRQWDAAYVFGSLVPSERQEFEEHLAGCAGCSAAVAELAGMPGLLADLPAQEAEALDSAGSTDTPPGLLTGLAEKMRRQRRRARMAVTGLVVAVSAASVGSTVVVTASAPPAVQTQTTAAMLTFDPVGAGPLTATGSLTDQPWGTRIDWKCSYGPAAEAYPSGSDASEAGAQEYSLVVIDTHGGSTQVASWHASPGTVVAPTATTSIKASDISRVEIRSVTDGRTLLGARL